MTDQTKKLERLEAFEERLGVRIEALYANLDEGSGYTVNNKFLPGIRITGEIHPKEGTQLAQRIKIVADAYDLDGRVVCTESTASFDPEIFYGYETFGIVVGRIPAAQIVKIRVYPKPARY